MTVTNRLKSRTRSIESNTGVLVGKNPSTLVGGSEGVLNGGTHATLTVVSQINDVVALTVYVQATPNGAYVPRAFAGPLAIGPLGKGSLLLEPADLAAYAIAITAASGTDGDLTVDWTVTR